MFRLFPSTDQVKLDESCHLDKRRRRWFPKLLSSIAWPLNEPEKKHAFTKCMCGFANDLKPINILKNLFGMDL